MWRLTCCAACITADTPFALRAPFTVWPPSAVGNAIGEAAVRPVRVAWDATADSSG